MKEQTVFKVVAVDGKRLVSAAQKSHQITYIPQIEITPKIGKIFVFKSQVAARAFIKRFLTWGNSTFQIWESIGTNVTKMNFVACSSHVTDFWNGYLPNEKFPRILKMPPPDGTLFADKIKMIKKVT